MKEYRNEIKIVEKIRGSSNIFLFIYIHRKICMKQQVAYLAK